MATFKMWAVVRGSRFIGYINATDYQDAIQKASKHERSEVFLCKDCSKEIMKPEIEEYFGEKQEFDVKPDIKAGSIVEFIYEGEELEGTVLARTDVWCIIEDHATADQCGVMYFDDINLKEVVEDV
jgi:hypothetical protein